MSTRYRRYELLVPLQFNDGRRVPDEFVAETILELRQRFGAVSSETQTIVGQWEHGGQVFRDRFVRLFVDVPDRAENRKFFLEFKERLKVRFEQIDIWLTTFRLDVL
jgi:hypothetical protein